MRCHKKTGVWRVSKLVHEHNHRGIDREGRELMQGRDAVSEEVLTHMKNCAASNMPPFMALRLLHETFPNLPSCVDERLYGNIQNEGRPVAFDDAHNLLELLKKAKELDDDWVVEYMLDPVTNRLTHLFWMSPEQVRMQYCCLLPVCCLPAARPLHRLTALARTAHTFAHTQSVATVSKAGVKGAGLCLSPQVRLAVDLFQIMIHDNTYKTNRFKLPLGVFCTVSRHGHTLLLACCLSCREGATDYEWAYGCWKRATGIDPALVLTDADPGATVAVALAFPRAAHRWCSWHIKQNLTKNLAGVLGAGMQDFLGVFATAGRQLTRAMFELLWERLEGSFPDAVPHLHEHLLPNVERWADYALQVFSAGHTATQVCVCRSACVCFALYFCM